MAKLIQESLDDTGELTSGETGRRRLLLCPVDQGDSTWKIRLLQ